MLYSYKRSIINDRPGLDITPVWADRKIEVIAEKAGSLDHSVTASKYVVIQFFFSRQERQLHANTVLRDPFRARMFVR